MTPSVAKLTFVLLAIGWYAIRFEHARRSRRVLVRHNDRDMRENVLLLISLSGLGICRATSPVYWINRGECLAETCFCCGAGSAAAF